MKRNSILKIALVALIAACAGNGAQALDIKDALKKAADKAKSSNGSSVSAALGSLLSTDKVELSSLNGNWGYTAPAVQLKSGNALKKAGGVAASSAIESKLEPIYKTAGLSGMTLTINAADSTFTMKVRSLNLSGTIRKSDSTSGANFVMKFKAVKKLNLGSLNTYVTRSANGTTDLTFDVSKLISLVEKVGSLTKNSTLTTATNLLKSYDGLTAGFRLKKTSK